MKNRLIFLLLFVLGTAVAGVSQEAKSTKFAFSMPQPKGWFRIKKDGLTKNLAKFDFTEAEIEKLLKEQNSSVLMAAFTKYDPKTTPGVIPTIQVALRPNTTKDFRSFKAGLIRSLENLRKQFDEFKLIEEPSEVEIGGIKSFLMHATFVMKAADGRIFKVRTRTYSVPRPGSFYQINFTDSPEVEDCTAEFDKLVRTIEIGN